MERLFYWYTTIKSKINPSKKMGLSVLNWLWLAETKPYINMFDSFFLRIAFIDFKDIR